MDVVKEGQEYSDRDGRKLTLTIVRQHVPGMGTVVEGKITDGKDRGRGVYKGRLTSFMRQWAQ